MLKQQFVLPTISPILNSAAYAWDYVLSSSREKIYLAVILVIDKGYEMHYLFLEKMFVSIMQMLLQSLLTGL